MSCAVFSFDDGNDVEPTLDSRLEGFEAGRAVPAANSEGSDHRWLRRVVLAAVIVVGGIAALPSAEESRWTGVQPVPGHGVTGFAVPAY